MRNQTDRFGRLIKILLPPHLVGAMDDVIAASGVYADRSEFIADAVDGHLAELRAHEMIGYQSTVGRLETRSTWGTDDQPVPESQGIVAAIPPVSNDTPTLEANGGPLAGPTWGMHNRDFPTLWALTHLIRITRLTGEPVPFSDWIPQVVADAWDLGRRLPTDRFDVSGFPTNAAKREASESRFMRFFVGDAPGSGPLFDLGLTANDGEGRIAATRAGLALLSEVVGFSCERGRGIPSKWTRAYLRHLERYAPADLAFLLEILQRIRDGDADRSALVEATSNEHPDWSSSVVDTNIAGFVARAREWGLLLPRQRKGRYVLEDEGIAVLEEVMAG